MKRKYIALISITVGSQGVVDKSYLPLGLLYVGSMLKREGFEPRIYHIFPHEIDRVVKAVANESPLWCGLSVLSGATTYWSFIASQRIKDAAPDIPIVWGGHHSSLTAAECLKEACIDVVVRGEGEITAVELSKALLENGLQGLTTVQGVSARIGDSVTHNPDRPLIENLDDLPFDYSLIDFGDYFRLSGSKKRYAPFFSSRGCPFNCAFCSTPKYSGRVYRYHSVAYITDQVKYLKQKHDINSAIFSDDNFYLHKTRAREIISMLTSHGIDCDTIDLRLDQLDEDDLDFFESHNVNGIFFGWESGSDRMLQLIRKGITTADILSKAEMIGKRSIKCWGSSMILMPTEEIEDTMATLEMSIHLRRVIKNSTMSLYRFIPLPKTDLTDLAIKNGFRYPASQREWIKTDPIEREYRVEWIPWYNDKYERAFRYVQELSRTGIADYIDGVGGTAIIKNLIALSVNRRMRKLDFRVLIERPIYDFLLGVYSLLRKRPFTRPRTKILD